MNNLMGLEIEPMPFYQWNIGLFDDETGVEEYDVNVNEQSSSLGIGEEDRKKMRNGFITPPTRKSSTT